jgi:hypothetical protein
MNVAEGRPGPETNTGFPSPLEVTVPPECRGVGGAVPTPRPVCGGPARV